jgi:hypothetical protein
MQNQEPTGPTEEMHRQRLVFWFAMFISLMMYLIILSIVPTDAAGENPALSYGLLAAAVGLVAISLLIKGRLPGSRRQGINPLVIPMALCEAAGLFGVVVHFVTGAPTAPYFILLGAFGMILHFPRRAG